MPPPPLTRAGRVVMEVKLGHRRWQTEVYRHKKFTVSTTSDRNVKVQQSPNAGRNQLQQSELRKRLRGSQAVLKLTPTPRKTIVEPLDLVNVIVFIAVPHGNALHPSFPHWRRGLLQGEAVSHRLVHLTVQRGVQHTLQAEVPVLFLPQTEKKQIMKGSYHLWWFRLKITDKKNLLVWVCSEVGLTHHDKWFL